MVPGSTLRYGSSFCSETVKWRAFRMFPMDAAVMPFPSEETTPPVTKTYFDIETSRAVLAMVAALGTGRGTERKNQPRGPHRVTVRPQAGPTLGSRTTTLVS